MGPRESLHVWEVPVPVEPGPLAAAAADRIERGQLTAGQMLPTAAELAETHEVALSTA